ncbi:MAG TPA: RluA family pseudouridine synthase [candidate division Zixibacteria bacterium]|nr:RluA family pseudouridine synthase [candidate division Zixibacteria bacterium]
MEAAAAGVRLDVFVARRLAQVAGDEAISRAAAQKLIAAGLVTVNGARAKPATRLKLHDVVEIRRPAARPAPAIEPEAIELDVLFEDEDCIVVNKPAGMLVHPAGGQRRGTLVNALLHHCPDLQGIGGERRPGIVHRLDKDTSGVIVVAKNDLAYTRLARQFKSRRVAKEYLGLVWGRMGSASGVIDRPIGRHRSDRKRMSSLHALARKREAVTEWTVEREFAVARGRRGDVWVTLLRLRPRTGRTHQLRVHLSDWGHAIVGDPVYGGRRREATGIAVLDSFPRQALHAERLGFEHPRTGQAVEFHAPVPEDMAELLRALEDRASGQVDGTASKGLTRTAF